VRENHQATLVAEASEALGKLGVRTPEAKGLLERLLGHGDEEVRGAAALALGKVGGTEQAEKLRASAATESFAWVKRRMLEAADKLK
jgi:HEAT repeat protein